MDHASLPALLAADPTIAAAVMVRMAAAVAAGGLGMFPQIDFRVKGVMVIVLAAAALPTAIAAELPAMPSLVPLLAGEAVVGLGLGLVVAIVFAAASWAGGIAAGVAGLSWADHASPYEATGEATVARLAAWLAVAGFLAAGGHLAVIAGLVESVGRFPIGAVAGDGLLGLAESVVPMPAAALELAWSLAAPAVAAVITFHLAVAICLRSVRFTAGAGLLQAAASLVLLAAILQSATAWTDGFAALARGPLDRGLVEIRP
jgi:flagellar biosynthetic protein FliR